MSSSTKIEWTKWLGSLIDGGSLPRLSRTLRALSAPDGVPNSKRIARDIGENPVYVSMVRDVAIQAIGLTRKVSLDDGLDNAEPHSWIPSEYLFSQSACEEERFDLSDARNAFKKRLLDHASVDGWVTARAMMLRYQVFLLEYEEEPGILDDLPPALPALEATWKRGPYRAKGFRFDILARWLAAQPNLSFKVTHENLHQLKRRLRQYIASQPDLVKVEKQYHGAWRDYEECLQPIRRRDGLLPPPLPATTVQLDSDRVRSTGGERP